MSIISFIFIVCLSILIYWLRNLDYVNYLDDGGAEYWGGGGDKDMLKLVKEKSDSLEVYAKNEFKERSKFNKTSIFSLLHLIGPTIRHGKLGYFFLIIYLRFTFMW